MFDLTRKQFIGTVALGTAASVLGAGVAAADEGSSFDAEYDVVVLGMGGAGMNAAIAAYEEGANVLLCEKAPEGQDCCNTKFAGQVILSTDDADQMYLYLKGLMGKYGNYDDECLRSYAEGAAENWHWMVDVLGGDPDIMYWPNDPDWVHQGGARFEKVDSFMGIDRPGWILIWDEFPELEGSDHALIFTFSGYEDDGSYYWQMRDNIDRREGDRLTVWRGAPGLRLIMEDGAVVGCVVEKDGEELRVRARGGGVLATGGFESNQTMLANYPQIPYCHSIAGYLNTGDGIDMAVRAGAQLWHMGNISGLGFGYHKPDTQGVSGAWYIAGAKWGVLAGPNGGRFMNEEAKNRHGRVSFGGSWKMFPAVYPAYLIVDSEGIQHKLTYGFSDGNADEIAAGDVLCADTVEELSAKIRELGNAPDFNLNGELDEALAIYNKHVELGEKDAFGRECAAPVQTGPFYALEVCPTLLNTQGGPRHNGMSQVLNMDGMPIEGLFSGGELGSIFPDMYNGGGNLGETMIFGRIAGRNAAHRAQGTFEGATEPAILYQETLNAQK